MRFLDLSLTSRVPDANSIWNFREALTRAVIDGKPAIEVLFKRFDGMLNQSGFIAMGGQIIDATIVAAPRQRNTEAQKKDIKEGRIPEDWKKSRAKLAQKDRDARWTVKHSKAKPAGDGAKRIDIAIPMFGYKNHIGIDRKHLKARGEDHRREASVRVICLRLGLTRTGNVLKREHRRVGRSRRSRLRKEREDVGGTGRSQ
jgi:hypothetical protein